MEDNKSYDIHEIVKYLKPLLCATFEEDHATNGSAIQQQPKYLKIINIMGLVLSLVTGLLAIVIFKKFRVLQTTRTLIHIGLLGSLTFNCVVHLIIDVDLPFVTIKQHDHHGEQNSTVSPLPYIFETYQVLLEYSTNAIFTWMLMEGYYLNELLNTDNLMKKINRYNYALVGWGGSFVITFIWIVYNTWCFYSDQRCFLRYNVIVLQLPKFFVIAFNSYYLLKISFVLIIKLRRAKNSLTVIIRKTARAALVLLPILGIMNVLDLFETSLGSAPAYMNYSFISLFTSSLQGFFVALVYCFLNVEVHQALKKAYNDYILMHPNSWFIRYSPFNRSNSTKAKNGNIRNKRCREAVISFELKPIGEALANNRVQVQSGTSDNQPESFELNEIRVEVEVQHAAAVNEEYDEIEEIKNSPTASTVTKDEDYVVTINDEDN